MLAATDGIDRVIGVDVVPPRGDVGAMSFIRADIRTPVIAKVIAKEDVDTVVHMSVIATPGSAGGRGTTKELNVIGTMQLLAACQNASSGQAPRGEVDLDRLRRELARPGHVHRGDGAAPQPALGVQQGRPGDRGLRPRLRPPTSRRPGRDAATGQRGRPDVVSPMASYFRLPVIPDRARVRRPHAVRPTRATSTACSSTPCSLTSPATFNVAGDGISTLSQAVRRLQRATVPLPGFAVGQLGSALRQARLADFSPEQLSFLTFGRGIDTTRMRTVLGFEPDYTTAEAFADFASSMPATSRVSERAVAGLADLLPTDHPADNLGATRG